MRQRALIVALASALGVALAAGLALHLRWLEPLQLGVGDVLLRTALRLGPPPLPDELPDTAVVALDAQSLRHFGGEWPWPRARFGALVGALDRAGAAAIAFDIDFSSARDPADDAAFARALEASGRVLLSAHRQFQEVPGVGPLELASLPTPVLARVAAGVGSVVVALDRDGSVRRAFRSQELAGERLPGLPAAALAVARGGGPGAAAGGPPLGAAASGGFAIDYRRALPPIPQLSAADVLEGRFDAGLVRGRVVFVGATAVEFQDLWETPLAPNDPGVWIQAVALRTLAAERAGLPVLRRAGPGSAFALCALLSLLAAGLGTAPALARAAGLGALALGTTGGALALLARGGLLLDPVLPLGVLAVHYALGLEVLRRRFRRGLVEREHSLTALAGVGEATVGATPSAGLQVGLSLLGDVMGARGVALLRASPEGQLDGTRLEWRVDRRPDPTRPLGCERTAAAALAARNTEVFHGALPGSAERGLAVYQPLYAGDAPAGVLVLERADAQPLDATQQRTLATVGAQLALAVENLRLFENVRATFEGSIEAIASAVEARDGYTELHCRRLAAFSVLMAEAEGLPPEEVEAIRLGALLHDVGKIGIRDAILLKSGRLTPEDRREIERHPDIGHDIIAGIPGLARTTLDCVRHHHEKWDGSGYPDGLRGDAIPLGARIVTVVDVWDALSTQRPYKAAFPPEKVDAILRGDSGSHFDPRLVERFFELLEEYGDEIRRMPGGTKERDTPR